MKTPTAINGKHILAEFWQCQCNAELIYRAEPLTSKLCAAVHAVGLTLVGQASHEFLPIQASEYSKNTENQPIAQTSQINQSGGFTVSLLLAESHLCLHTWGETATVTLDIYVCNFLNDNSQKAEKLLQICRDLLQPRDYNIHTVNRLHAPLLSAERDEN